ncbi:putative cyclase [Gonapodya prolifera JEL478]|uniref:Putative cyclase n=1 Tax=Gonapodya prolifera (strain JEL478) TaxID=1344416 RepID=A0A139AHX4_GONPJ|nr:putative cyclase [Gonapodya prolifera JEL478]|eukprot:KXS16416.1 putative cyclase [Gonapodya prolifera JEL478]
MGSQSGTHVDAPFHVDNSLPKLDEVPLETFAGPAVVVDVRGKPPRTEFGPEVLQDVRDRLKPGVIVLFATGWDAHWDLPPSSTHPDNYLAHPWPSTALATILIDAGIRCVGIDALSVDRTPDPSDPPSAFSLATHFVLAQQGGIIVENLRGLGEVLDGQAWGESVEVFVMPIRLEGGDGAPVRAVAKLTSAV